MKRIIVTGAAGFVGSHLVDQLLEQGNHVIGIDNLQTGSTENIAHLTSNEHFEFFEHDITNAFEIDAEIDEIYNLACPASPVHYQKDPIHTLNTCFVGTQNLIHLALDKNATLLQASTSEVYGDPEVHPQPEDYRGNVNTMGPRACYDEGKRVAETLCSDYNRVHNLKLKVVRIFNTYGPRMARHDGRVVSNFITQALSGREITIYGRGDQTRSFCYVSDLVDGLIKMMESNPEVTGPVNLGNPDEYTIAEFADIVLDLTQSKSKKFYKDLPQDDPTRRKPNIKKANDVLGWKPQVSLQEGLQKTIAYFNQ